MTNRDDVIDTAVIQQSDLIEGQHCVPADQLDGWLAGANTGQDLQRQRQTASGAVDRAMYVGARMHAGEVKIDGCSVLDLAADSQQSFFGVSGIGGHGVEESLRLFTGTRIVGVDDPTWPI